MHTRPDVSYQLYSSRKFPDLARQARMLSDIGFRQVEPYDALLADPDSFKKALDLHGLEAPTAHVGLATLREDFDGAMRRLRSIGTRTAIVPFLPASERAPDADGWRRLGMELRDHARQAADHGLALGWHNHDFEFARQPDGSMPLEWILGEDAALGWQADIAWMARAGQEPGPWIDRYASRIISFHVKDLAPPGENADEDGWADVGHGRLDWAALLPAMRRTPATIWTVEHDNPSDDARFARRSFATVSAWWAA